jgi:hypothetical protein
MKKMAQIHQILKIKISSLLNFYDMFQYVAKNTERSYFHI